VSAIFAIPAAAQTRAARADIPFAFIVDGKTLPAGMYTISSGWNHSLTISDNNGHFAMALSLPAERKGDSEETKLVFQHSGSAYALTELWLSSDRAGLKLPASGKGLRDFVEVAVVR
jgi:hypothetical protein